jgi:phage terminase large subunit
MINVSISKKVFNDVYLPYLDNEDRYLLFYGGGSSGKSYFIVQRYIYKMLKNKMNLLVVRQTGNTNRNSTFALFKQVISQWNLSGQFKINESDLRIKCVNGNEIIFSGLDDTEKLKSVTFESGELTDIWVEEATETLEEDINQLKVRLRGGKSKKQIVLSFNPVNINHWIKRHFIDSGLATVCHSTYKDNKFLTEEDKKTLESFKDTDIYYYNVYCLGEWGVLGKTYFNAEKVTNRITQVKEPIKAGSFIYDYDGLKITKVKWQNDINGFIKIYEEPKANYPYVIGGDTAGDGSDYFIGQVLDNTTGKQVAVLRKQFDEDEYSRQMICLGRYYNNALEGIEANFSTFPIKELERLGYKKQYVRDREDTYTGKPIKAYGFKTTGVTRPLILAQLQAIVNDHIELINDKDTLEEMLTFVRNEKGRPEAQQGAHDDLVMALAIAHYIRSQQDMAVKIDQHELEYNIMKDFGFERESENEFGSKIEVF